MDERLLEQLVKWAETQGFRVEYKECFACEGKGSVDAPRFLQNASKSVRYICSQCEGTGKELK